MSREAVDIVFDEDGTATVSVVEGPPGVACKDLTKDFEKALGRVVEDRPTADMYRKTTARVRAGR